MMDDSEPNPGEATYYTNYNSNNSWTPVSVLREFSATNELVPDYQLISVVGAVHDPTYTYRLTVGDLVKTASGQSKKKAKHAAALTALHELSQQYSDIPGYEYVVNSTLFTGEPQPKEEEVNVCGDSNPVGKLQEICMKKRWTVPKYEDVGYSGQPHEPTFTVECQFEKHDLHVVGVGKSKKLAKRIAAERMLRLLEEMKLYNPSAISSADKATKYNTDGSNGSARNNIHAKDRIDDFYRNISEELSGELSDVFANTGQADYLDTLQEIADCIRCKIKFREITEVSLMEEEPEADKSYVVHLIPKNRRYESDVPILSGWGTGPGHDEAKSNAAKTWVFLFEQIYSSFAIKQCNPFPADNGHEVPNDPVLDECWD